MARSALDADPEFEVSAALGRGDDLEAALDESPDVALDLTIADSAAKNALACLARACPVVVGATGLSAAETKEIEAAAEDVGAMIVPNFAIGAVLMMRLAALAGRWLPDAEIVEIHHERKLDAPSGTALRTAGLIAEARRRAPRRLDRPGHSARGLDANGVPIHSLRLPGHLAAQSVVFGGEGESLTIRHDTLDRNVYASGIKLALRHVRSLDRLEVGLDRALFGDV